MSKEVSTWGLIAQAFKQDLKPALKRALAPSLILSLLFVALTYPTHLLDLSDNQRLGLAVYEVFMALFEAILLSMITVHSFHGLRMSLGEHFTLHIKHVAIEVVRTLPHILAYSLLLLIPGIVKTVQFLFVPFIVQNSKSYSRGETDALQRSQLLMKGHLAKFFFFYIILQALILGVSLGLPGLFAGQDQQITFKSFILHLVFVGIFGIILELIGSIIFYASYIKIVRQRGEDSNELAF